MEKEKNEDVVTGTFECPECGAQVVVDLGTVDDILAVIMAYKAKQHQSPRTYIMKIKEVVNENAVHIEENAP